MSGPSISRAPRPVPAGTVTELTIPQLAASDTWRSGAQSGLPSYVYDQTWIASLIIPEDGTLTLETSPDAVTWTTAATKATVGGVANIVADGSDTYFRLVFVNGPLAQTGPGTVALTIDLQPA